MMQLDFTQKLPLTQDTEGTIRLKGSRVTLDTLVAAYERGESVEEIQDGFPSLTISQIGGAIAWYLDNQEEADNYLNKRAAEAEEIRRTVESRFDHAAFRDLVLRRYKQLTNG
jgi:uncharacterized protein (DUF433 family)